MLRSGRSAAPFRRGQPLPALPWNRRGSATVQAGFWCGAAPRPVRLTVVIALIYVGGRRNAPTGGLGKSTARGTSSHDSTGRLSHGRGDWADNRMRTNK